jgi:hypothetical protein
MADDKLKLTYRELADRLGVSPDAARMKAKRAVKSGRWTIIPGNHPSDPVRVELPAADANKPERVAGEREARSPGERTGRTPDRTEPSGVVEALQSAQARITELTDQLTAEKDRHRETAVELATATTKADFLEAELARIGAEADDLREELRRERRTLWQRLIGK